VSDWARAALVGGLVISPAKLALDMVRTSACNERMTEPDDPTRIARRPITPMPPSPAHGAITFGQVATGGGALCIECRSCDKRAALTKAECPAIRTGNRTFVLHATFRCSACGAGRLSQATMDEAKMFLAGDPLRRQIGR
jgi:hypothetical protein